MSGRASLDGHGFRCGVRPTVDVPLQHAMCAGRSGVEAFGGPGDPVGTVVSDHECQKLAAVCR